MLSTSQPPKFPVPFANSAGPDFIRPIPVESQIGIQDGAASLTTGFVPDNFNPVAAGGVPPFGQDMNGLLKQVTQQLQWEQAGGPAIYDADFAAAIGGYPKGAELLTRLWTPGTRWMSTVESNLVDPDVDQTGWAQSPNQILVGSPVAFLTSTVPFGYVPANASTVGNAASGATLASNVFSFLLFSQIWTGYPNSQCPVFDSAGGLVARGASPLADYNANRRIQVPDLRGRGVWGIDTMFGGSTSRLTGIPVGSGSTTTPGSILGENFHQLTTAELAVHAHANSLNDPTHLHGTVDGGHVHNNSLTDPGHFHHLIALDASLLEGSLSPDNFPRLHFGSDNNVITDSRVTNVTINNAGAVTGLSVSASSTGMTISNANAGGNTAHNNVAQVLGAVWGLKL